MTYLPTEIGETEGGDKTAGSKQFFGKYGKPNTGRSSSAPTVPDHPIFPFKWANFYFGIQLKCATSFGAGDPDLAAAKQFLKDQFQYSDEEAEAALKVYRNNDDRTFWQTYFEAKEENDDFNVGETCGGYLWRLFRKNQSAYSAKRDFLILLLIEYSKDKNKLSAEDLNKFIRVVNDLPVTLTPERIQETFFKEEENTKNVWLQTAHEKEQKRLNRYTKKQDNSVPEITPETPRRDDYIESANKLEEKEKTQQEVKKSQMLLNPHNYEYSSNIASNSLKREAMKDENLFDINEEQGLNYGDFYDRFSRYLDVIVLQQVKYNYVKSQKKPMTYEEFENYAPQIDEQLKTSDGGQKAEQILSYYRKINAKYGVPPVEVTVNNDSNEYYQSQLRDQVIAGNQKAIAANVRRARSMQNMRLTRDFKGQPVWVDGEIPASLYLSDEILAKIIGSKPEDINDEFLLEMINGGMVGSIFGFRNWNKNDGAIGLEATGEFMEIEKYVRTRAQIKTIRAVNEKFLSQGEIIPVHAVILPNEVSKSVLKTIPIELRIYLKKIGENEWQVIDLTNPVDKNPHRPTAKGTSDINAIEKALILFSENDDSYVPGKFVVALPPQFDRKAKMIEQVYTGTSWQKQWSEWMATVGNVMNNIGMILRVIPHPFAQAAAGGFMLVGQVASGSAAALNIASRIEKGQFAWDVETFNEGLDLVGSVSGTMGKAFKGKAKLYFSALDKTTEVGGYVMIPVTLQSQIDKIRQDNTKTDAEKQQAIQGLVESTIWEQGKEMFFDRVTSNISEYHQKTHKRNKGVTDAAADAVKAPNKKTKTQLPQIEVEYKSMGRGKEAQLTSQMKIRLNKDIVINREKRLKKAIREEKAHIWVKILYAVEPEVYQGAIGRIKGANEFQTFQQSKEGLAYATLARQKNYSDKEISNFLAEEFLAKVINKEYKVLTFDTGAGSATYKKLIEAIEKLIEALGFGDGKITISQLQNVVKSGQKQMDGKGDYITKEKAEKILAFFNGDAEIDISILGKRRENVKVHEGASKEILFREMYRLDDHLFRLDEMNEKEREEWDEMQKRWEEEEAYLQELNAQIAENIAEHNKTASRPGQAAFRKDGFIYNRNFQFEEFRLAVPENMEGKFAMHHLIEHHVFDEGEMIKKINKAESDPKKQRMLQDHLLIGRFLEAIGFSENDLRLSIPLLQDPFESLSDPEKAALAAWENAPRHHGSHIHYYDKRSLFALKIMMENHFGIKTEADLENFISQGANFEKAVDLTEFWLIGLRSDLMKGEIKLNKDK